MGPPEVGSAQGEHSAARHAAGRYPYSSVRMVRREFCAREARVLSSEQEGWVAVWLPEERVYSFVPKD